jgi:hypothetical protein
MLCSLVDRYKTTEQHTLEDCNIYLQGDVWRMLHQSREVAMEAAKSIKSYYQGELCWIENQIHEM